MRVISAKKVPRGRDINGSSRRGHRVGSTGEDAAGRDLPRALPAAAAPRPCQARDTRRTRLDTAERCPRPNFGEPPTNNAVDSDDGVLTDDKVRSIAIQRTVSRCDRPTRRQRPRTASAFLGRMMRASNRRAYTDITPCFGPECQSRAPWRPWHHLRTVATRNRASNRLT